MIKRTNDTFLLRWSLMSFIFDRFALQYSIIIFGKMEKHSWQKVTYLKSSLQPPARWGHSVVKVQQRIVIFGGYAESHYMNDMWSFNTEQMAWEQCKTYGHIPSPRSNCTLHYQPIHKNIVLFGGGGPQKQRFNDVHILDWQTKQWRLVVPVPNQKILWERTYHSSQILYPYLVVFGGEGISDLDDLWAFNLQNYKWSQLKIGESKLKPCSRRFHSSVVIDNTFYVIAGCHDKYRCLCDIFTIDLTPFVKEQKIDALQWKQLSIKNASFLTRWGHTSTVFHDKIYIFGGRFSNDLQDILVLDPQKQRITTMKVHGQVPKPRRRHSSIMVGSNMVVFGGFNGQYFNDTHYINVFELPSRTDIEYERQQLQGWVNNQMFSDYTVSTQDKLSFYIHKGLLANRFNNEQQLMEFLNHISYRFSLQDLSQIFNILYKGIGAISEDYFLSTFQFNIFESEIQKNRAYLSRIGSPQPIQSLQGQSKNKPISRVVSLQSQTYCQYLQNTRASAYKDKHIIFNQEYSLPVNSVALATNSLYFYNLFKNTKQKDVNINLQEGGVSDVRIFQVMLHYLQSGFVVVPKDIGQACWIVLGQLAQYCCLLQLSVICQVQLTHHINEQNCQQLLYFAIYNHFTLLQSYCGQYLFRIRYEKDSISFAKHKGVNNLNGQQKHLQQYFDLFGFDLQQLKLKNKGSQATTKIESVFSQSKQNYSSITN